MSINRYLTELPYPFFIEWETPEEIRFAQLRAEGTLTEENEQLEIRECVFAVEDPLRDTGEWAVLLSQKVRQARHGVRRGGAEAEHVVPGVGRAAAADGGEGADRVHRCHTAPARAPAGSGYWTPAGAAGWPGGVA